MGRKIASFALLAGLAGLLLAPPASAGHSTQLVAFMTGSAERPGPGDPDGVGRAVVTVNPAAGTVCLALQFTNVTLPTTGLHIHEAPPTESGPVVIGFSAPTTNQSYQCVPADEELLADIVADPGDYYVNLHTQPLYAAGAIRGQLQPV